MIKITIKEIAKDLNISIATVSRALNPETEHLVKTATRQKIFDYAAKKNFTPNSTARKLATGKSNTIVAFFKPQPYSAFFDDYYSKFIAGLVDSVSNTNYKINISLIKDENKPYNLRNAIYEMDDIAAAIVCSWSGILQSDNNGFKNISLPTLYLNLDIPEIKQNKFCIDDRKSSYNAVKYLISMGHKKIGFIKGKKGIEGIEERFSGYQDALKDNNIPFDEKLCFSSNYLETDGEKAVKYFFVETDLNPTAIFFSDDSMAIVAIEQMKKLNITCPDQVSVMGFDGLNIGRYCSPPLTSVSQPAYEMAYQGVKQLIDLIENKRKTIGKQIFDTSIVQRESVKNMGE